MFCLIKTGVLKIIVHKTNNLKQFYNFYIIESKTKVNKFVKIFELK